MNVDVSTITLGSIFAVVGTIALVGDCVLAYLSYRLQRRNRELQETISQIKMFDEPTALAMLQRTRMHQNNVRGLRDRIAQRGQESSPKEFEFQELMMGLAELDPQATDILLDMIRVYKLSGADIGEKFDRWVEIGLFPEEWRHWFLG